MKCAICNIETHGNDVRWGPEFAHELCIKIYGNGINVGKNWAAEVCDKRAALCATRADLTDDEDDRTELKSNAWQFSVLAAEIRKRTSTL